VIQALSENFARLAEPQISGAAEHTSIGGAIIENPCGVPFNTPHGFVFL